MSQVSPIAGPPRRGCGRRQEADLPKVSYESCLRVDRTDVAGATTAAKKRRFRLSAISQARSLVPNLATYPLDRAEKLNAFKA